MDELLCDHDQRTVVRALKLLAVSYRLARAEHPYWRASGRRARQLCPEVCAEVVHGLRDGTVPEPESPGWNAYLDQRARHSGRRRKHRARSTSNSTAASQESGHDCVLCGKPLSQTRRELGASSHRKCIPVECRDCGRIVPKTRTTRSRRCVECSGPAQLPRRPRRAPRVEHRQRVINTPWEQAYREQARLQRERAKRRAELAAGPHTSATRPPVRFVRGGLPEHTRRKH